MEVGVILAIARTRTRGFYQNKELIGRCNTISYYSPGFDNTYYRERSTCVDETHPGPPWKDGGPLNLSKYIVRDRYHSTREYDSFRDGTTSKHIYYVSNLRQCHTHPANASSALSEIDSLFGTNVAAEYASSIAWQYGPAAWNRFRPGKSNASLGQFLGELRDFKRLFKAGLKSYKDLGSQHLNYHFGWKPFLSDIAKYFNTIMKIDNIIRFYRKNNGKWIKRGGTLLTDGWSKNTSVTGKVQPTLVTYCYPSPYVAPRTNVTCNYSKRVWFKARMKFYIPDLKTDKAENMFSSKLMRHIYGFKATPSLVWELTPWSWLADWLGNIGDMLETMSDQSYTNLVAKYAYIMCERFWDVYYTTTVKYFTYEYGIHSITSSSSHSLIRKERDEASPYGFGSSWDGFSAYQLSILAALGISRR